MTHSHSLSRHDHDWLITGVCVLALLTVAYVLVLFGLPPAVIVVGLVTTCIAVCLWAFWMADRTHKAVESRLLDDPNRP